MKIAASSILRFLPLVLLLVPALSAHAIIIRHDRADSSYQVFEENYPQLFFLHYRFNNKVCMATLVGSQWAITAAHCTEQTPILESMNNNNAYEVTIAGRPYQIREVVLHPQHNDEDALESVDLALIRLDRDVTGVLPVILYRDSDEQDRIFSLLGWGFTGIGTRGLQNNDGKFRRAENQVIEAGQWLKFRFDDPRKTGNQALPLEGVPGLGDSGGPALLETEQGFVLAGVALGELEEAGHATEEQGKYGAIEVYERISSHIGWIEQVIHN